MLKNILKIIECILNQVKDIVISSNNSGSTNNSGTVQLMGTEKTSGVVNTGDDTDVDNGTS